MRSSKSIVKRKGDDCSQKSKKEIHFRNQAVVNVKTSAVYSRIAVTGRNPNKVHEHIALITALEQSYIEVTTNGRIRKKDPHYVEMSIDEVERCFGENFQKVLCS